MSTMRAASVYIAMLLLLASFILRSAPVHAQAGQSARPRLVLFIVLDQFSYDYLTRYQDKFSTGGFGYLLESAANFVNCRYPQANAQTAVGHSIISTGAYPWSTGIIANDWFDRRKGKETAAFQDDSLQLIGANGPAAGTRHMVGTTFGDQMKLCSNGRSKVFTISLKDRASLPLAGRLANGAYWWDVKSGNFVTSSQYGRELQPFVRAFNDLHYADRFFGKAWQRVLPEGHYLASSRDDFTYEKALPGDGRQFPHVITGGAGSVGEAYYSAFAMTPWANQMIADLGKEAIDKEGLGQHSDADCLGLSFSAGDLLGHSFGPYSQETEDLVLRLDQTLSGLFTYVDQKVGLDKTLLVVTADHGVMPIPEFLKERGMDAGRIDPATVKNLIDSALDARLGQADWVQAFVPPNLYLNLDAIDRQKYHQPDVEALAAKIAHSIQGIGEVYTAFQFFMNQLPSGPLAEAARRNYYWGRSGELMILPKPNYVFIDEPNGTSHCSPYAYDAHVPLFIRGPGIRPGLYAERCSPCDIAPTLAAILGLDLPSQAEGCALAQAVAQAYGPPRPRSTAQPDAVGLAR